MNKASEGDEIPAELLKLQKGDGVKVLHSICQQIWKIRQWPQDGKSQFSFQSQRRAIPKSIQTLVECTIALILHASKVLLKSP